MSKVQEGGMVGFRGAILLLTFTLVAGSSAAVDQYNAGIQLSNDRRGEEVETD